MTAYATKKGGARPGLPLTYLDLFSAVDPLVGQSNASRPVLTVFGVPYDGTTSYRPGTRFGPNAIRQAFLNVEAYSKPLGVDVEKLPIRDAGNLARVIDPKKMADNVSKVTSEFYESRSVFCMLGGEHSLTYGAFRNAPAGTGFVVFDAHFDLRDEWEGSRYSHACYLRRLTEKTDPRAVAHIGGRAATKDEWKLSEKFGLVISPGEAGTSASLKRLAVFCSTFKRIYVSIDIDGLDPAFAPGTGTPEAGGLSSKTILDLLYQLKGRKIAGFDIMEVSPPYDNGTTSVAAARFMNELAALVSIAGS
ncbi:MAG: agmatinase [Thaumarchaeota archaeon]|nr:agmatinase [Nitrososphaerota archaeon]